MIKLHERFKSCIQNLGRSLSGRVQDREGLMRQMREALECGLIDLDALEMLEGVLGVAEIQVRDIMVPRSQMVTLERDASAATLLPIIVESGHSRFPVLDGHRDDIVGILLAKDVLRVFAASMKENFDIRECMRPAVIVPESKRVNVLLKEFRRNRNHMAIVIDEYGGVAGLVTIEDAIEQIVGDIDDEYDIEDEKNIRKESEQEFFVRGDTPIEDFNEYFGVALLDDEFDTVAGLVMKQLGHLPRRGESLFLGKIEFRVLRADQRKLHALKVIPPYDVIPLEERLKRD